DGYWTNWTYKNSVIWTIGFNNFISPIEFNFIGLISRVNSYEVMDVFATILTALH
ncbi:18363_t:CDS:2, partial [Funneliformis geosporum]